MGRALATLAAFLALVAPAAAQTSEPQRVLRSEPYYLGLYEAEGKRLGTVLLLHGGGWRGDKGRAADDEMRVYIDQLVSWGYDVANLAYRSGAPGLADALHAFDLLRERGGRQSRICLFGGSAGAHLALMVAAERGREVDCVVDLLGPPDLTEWGAQPAAALGRSLAIQAFGENQLAELSPINVVDRIESPVLVAAAPCDVFIELASQERFVDALDAAGGTALLQVIETGDEVPVGHCAVERASYEKFLEVAREFLAGDLEAAEAAAAGDEDGGFPWAGVAVGLVAVALLGYWVLSLIRSRTASI